jgi:hypothetical protein
MVAPARALAQGAEVFVAPLEEQQFPASVEQPINQVADLETILQERDACGVSGSPICRHLLFQTFHSRKAYPLPSRFSQVGFIASLKNHKSHTVVEQVGEGSRKD